MLVIGLTGSLATGKSSVASMFVQRGAELIDADAIVHQQMRPEGICFAPIVKLFGKKILTKEHIDRKKLADIVFKNREKLRKLTTVVHPLVRRKILEKIRQYKRRKFSGMVIIDVPLLFETGLNRMADKTITVKSRREIQIRRAIKQFKITRTEALDRIRAQMPLKQKIHLADFTIDNSGSLVQTKKQVKQIWEKVCLQGAI